MKTNKIKKRILIPLSLTLAILIIISIGGMFWLQQKNIQKTVFENAGSIQEILNLQIDEDALTIYGLMEYLKSNKEIEANWLAKDRQKLLETSTPIYQKLSKKYRITHLYFHQLDRVNFLRVHNPARHGDLILRYTLDQVAKKGLAFHGIELGPFGTFTLRVVEPWWINGELSGYIELGEEITHLTPNLRKNLGMELIFAVDKRHLVRNDWEEGLRMMNRNGSWDDFERVAIIDSTIKVEPDSLAVFFKRAHIIKNGQNINVKLKDRTYTAVLMPLRDVSKAVLGDILLLHDITEQLSAIKNLAATILVIALFLFLALFGFFYFYLEIIENRLEQHEMNIKNKQHELELSNEQLQLETVERQRATENAAVMEERGRLARELHDSVTQSLYSMTLFVETNKELAAKGDLEGLRRGLAGLDQCARDIQREFRLLVYDLRPSALEKEGLPGALMQRLEAVELRSGIKGSLLVEQHGDIPALIEEGLYRIAQEALNNALKHSNCTQVVIRLNISDAQIMMEVKDDGKGFKFTGFEQGAGMGMNNMLERAEKLGGTCTVQSEPGSGTAIRITIDKTVKE